jgi:hypothetical protein
MSTASAVVPDELLVSQEFLYDPYPILKRLREQDPVHWSDSIKFSLWMEKQGMLWINLWQVISVRL